MWIAYRRAKERYAKLSHPEIAGIVRECEGCITAYEACVLYEAVVSSRKPGRIIEVGAYKGLSTCILSIAAEKSGKTVHTHESFEGIRGVVDGLDSELLKPFEDGGYRGTYEEFLGNIWEFGCPGRIKLVSGDATKTLMNSREEFSIAFVDVDTYKTTKEVLLQLWELSKGGEKIYVHDFHSKGVQKAIREFMEERLGVREKKIWGSVISELTIDKTPGWELWV